MFADAPYAAAPFAALGAGVVIFDSAVAESASAAEKTGAQAWFIQILA